ncbi:hypothetical protein ROZALSC1DRAFT_26926 [Rozella allomycis CSF55]|uniref:Asteroid domain-containing protein n=1 Tax=Rozella allomycis (strain CSF55) TaxID=988480 RepID=A0A075AUJ3_ROZAC|nr:hypothetical protein O9G_001294 [Rozella allomycis CSF55]RKP21671.1 hypothetical protein ROZALSC1DRAFT_26926 [Rozella allomycis CSF55]|eukprot:EPZ32392.1 hypothetical protein O9G_001294 [Rozella allomycis CSF55]
MGVKRLFTICKSLLDCKKIAKQEFDSIIIDGYAFLYKIFGDQLDELFMIDYECFSRKISRAFNKMHENFHHIYLFVETPSESLKRSVHLQREKDRIQSIKLLIDSNYSKTKNILPVGAYLMLLNVCENLRFVRVQVRSGADVDLTISYASREYKAVILSNDTDFLIYHNLSKGLVPLQLVSLEQPNSWFYWDSIELASVMKISVTALPIYACLVGCDYFDAFRDRYTKKPIQSGDAIKFIRNIEIHDIRSLNLSQILPTSSHLNFYKAIERYEQNKEDTEVQFDGFALNLIPLEPKILSCLIDKVFYANTMLEDIKQPSVWLTSTNVRRQIYFRLSHINKSLVHIHEYIREGLDITKRHMDIDFQEPDEHLNTFYEKIHKEQDKKITANEFIHFCFKRFLQASDVPVASRYALFAMINRPKSECVAMKMAIKQFHHFSEFHAYVYCSCLLLLLYCPMDIELVCDTLCKLDGKRYMYYLMNPDIELNESFERFSDENQISILNICRKSKDKRKTKKRENNYDLTANMFEILQEYENP